MKLNEVEINETIKEYTLSNDHHMSVSILNLGGIITGIHTPNRLGQSENIVLAYKNYKQYLDDANYLGAIIGPVAGRIPNAEFTIDGKRYSLDKNNGKHHLHGGQAGFNKVLWDVKTVSDENEVGLILSKSFSHEMLSFYPSPIEVKITYTLNNKNQFSIKYSANHHLVPTILSLTNHTYFNLTGDTTQTVANHQVTIPSEQFIALDKDLIPTGQWLSAEEHDAFNFKKGKFIGEGLNNDYMQNKIAGAGYDHYFYFDKSSEDVIVQEEMSGRRMHISTSQPGMVLYTSNGMVENLPLKNGCTKKHQGICFETQGLPLPFGLNHEDFPSNLLDLGQTYSHETKFTFLNN